MSNLLLNFADLFTNPLKKKPTETTKTNKIHKLLHRDGYIEIHNYSVSQGHLLTSIRAEIPQLHSFSLSEGD